MREKARLCSLLKRHVEERKLEKQSWDLYCELYGTVPGWDQPEDSFKIDYLPVTVKLLPD